MCGAEYASRSWIAALRFGFTKYRQSSSYYNPSESSTQIHFESAYQADQGLIIGFGAEEYWNWETYPTADSDVRLDYNRAGVFGDAKFRLTGRLFSKVGVRLGSAAHSPLRPHMSPASSWLTKLTGACLSNGTRASTAASTMTTS